MNENPDFEGHALSVGSAVEALTHDYGNELWLGACCDRHWPKDKVTACAMLIHRATSKSMRIFVTILLSMVLEKLRNIPEPVLVIVERLALRQHEIYLKNKIRTTMNRYLGATSPNSPSWTAFRLIQLAAETRRGGSLAMVGVRDFVSYLLTVRPDLAKWIEKHAVKYLIRGKGAEKAESDAIIRIARLWKPPTRTRWHQMMSAGESRADPASS
jgi:hypothetical protein